MIEKRDYQYWKNEILKYDSNVSSSVIDENERVKMSESLLDGLRHFAEAAMCFIREVSNPKEYVKRYDEIQNSIKFCKQNSKLKFISSFHDGLNGSVGHQDFFGEYAERLFLKYYRALIRIKDIFEKDYNFAILGDLTKYPIDLDESFISYYRLILNVLSKYDLSNNISGCDSYYIQKKKMLYINNRIFYEYTLTNATDNNNKFDRFIAFSLFNIPDNYAIKARLLDKTIKFFGQDIDFQIIVAFKVAIRPCEFEKLSQIMSMNLKFNRSKEYWNLMEYLSEYSLALNVILEYDKTDYDDFSNRVFINNRETIYFKLFERCRSFLKSNLVGSNALRYLLYKMNNKILADQMPKNEDDCLSTIYLSKKVYGFDRQPFSTCPVNHIPHIKDLLNIYNFSDHKAELMAKTITSKSIEESCIYISSDEINIDDLDDVIFEYNSQFSKPSLEKRKISKIGNYLFLNENELNTKNVLCKLVNLTKTENFPDYSNYIEAKIIEKGFAFSDPCKEKALKMMFNNSSLFAVYGAAGAGKSYFANYVLKALDDINKVCVAATNPAVDNMRRRFDDNSAEYMTVTKYLKEYSIASNIDLLVIDECSTVSSKDMNDILSQTNPSLILLLGDTYQIKPISFGNWFSLLRRFINENCFIDLNNQYRSDNTNLLSLWNEVRTLGKNIQEILSMNEISHKFDDSIFTSFDNDEIILCLNYDGLYGINNLNRVLQKNNPNKEYKWKQYIFKVNDPIIFDDSYYYRSVFYNNLKGVIKGIEETNDKFIFTVKINKIVTPIACSASDVNYIGVEGNWSLVSFEVKKYGEDYYDNDTSGNTHIPFQIAYALSIHKAQGLEYNSVKIIISNEVEENITHSIFYTAITRAKKVLNIYWTPESEEKIISGFYIENCDNDANILASRYGELDLQNGRKQ